MTGAANYIVRRANSPEGPWSAIGTPKGTSFSDASVAAGMTYHYSVTATNGLAESSAAYAQPVTPSTLRLHLRFDETSGSNAADSSGRSWHATLVNAPTWVSGTDARLGGAVHLSGTGQRHLTLPQGIIGDLGDCTVAFWLRLAAINTWARVFDFNNGTTGSSMYFVPRTSGGLVRFGLSGQLLEAPPEIQFTTNTWTHVAITLTGNTGTLYLDGQPVATNNTMTYRPSFLGMTPFNFIGRSASTADPYLNGRVDEFLIFETPLDAAQIATLATVPAAPRHLQAMGIAGAVTLDWEALPGASAYEVRRSTNPAGPFASIATVPGQVLSHQDDSVMPGMTYQYLVAITGGVGTGSVSTVASATAPPAPPGFTEEETRAPKLEITGALVKLITHTSVQGHAYQLQVSETMAPDSWSALGAPIPGTGTALEFDIPHDPAKDRLFYRILISRQNP